MEAPPTTDVPTSAFASTLDASAKLILHDKILGTIIGSALGDTIGLYTEFLSKVQSKSYYPTGRFTLEKGGTTPFHIDRHRQLFIPGHWSDDTDHALLILLSYLHSNGHISPSDFAYRLRMWIDQGTRALNTLPLGLGKTVANVAKDKEFLQDPATVAFKAWSKGRYPNAANGSLMRIHPLGVICVGKTVEETFEITTENSTMTHADPRCIVSCLVAVGVIRGILRGEVVREKDIEGVVERAIDWYGYWDRDSSVARIDGVERPSLDLDELWRHVRATSLADLELDEGGKIGYVYKSLGSAILLLRLAMRRSKTDDTSSTAAVFEDLITALIMEGGDADTNACTAGAFLGAYLGHANLPPKWRDHLKHGDWLITKTEALCQILGVSDGTYVWYKDADTAPDGGKGFLTEKENDQRWSEFREAIMKSW